MHATRTKTVVEHHISNSSLSVRQIQEVKGTFELTFRTQSAHFYASFCTCQVYKEWFEIQNTKLSIFLFKAWY